MAPAGLGKLYRLSFARCRIQIKLLSFFGLSPEQSGGRLLAHNLEAPLDRYESSIAKTHEIRLLQLRRERKTESQRLDNLKKGLQAQLTTKADNRKIYAA